MTTCAFRLPLFLLLVLQALTWGPRFAEADQLTMNNGDRLTGTVVKAEKGLLTLKTEYSDELQIRLDHIRTIQTDQPVTVRLDQGEILSGALTSENGQVRVAAGAGRGAADITWSRVESINVEPPPPWSWSGDLFAGGNQQSGNTDRTSLSLGMEATRKSVVDRYNLSFLYNYAEENGSLTARDAYGSIKYDYFFTAKVYSYLAGEMLKDRFKDLNLRTVAGPGAGYQVWDDEVKFLSLDAGLSYFSEDRIEAEDDQWLSGRIGVKFHYQLLKRLKFSDTLALFPNLESGGDLTSRNEAVLITTLTGPWSLRISNIWEYDSAPAEGVKKTDLKSGASLQYNF